MNSYSSELKIRDLILDLHLGCTEVERQAKQEVRLTITLCFFQRPIACLTDRLEDTFCYGDFCQKIRNFSEGKEFHTIEGFTGKLGVELLPFLPDGIEMLLETHKVRPPVKSLLGGVVFREKFIK